MKTRHFIGGLIAVVLSLVLLLAGLGVGALLFKNVFFSPEPEQNFIARRFQVQIPREWEVLYENEGTIEGFDGGGERCDVFAADEADAFFASFRSDRDEKTESGYRDVLQALSKSDKAVPEKYVPDFGTPYIWRVVSLSHWEDGTYTDKKPVEGFTPDAPYDPYIILICQDGRLYTVQSI